MKGFGASIALLSLACTNGAATHGGFVNNEYEKDASLLFGHRALQRQQEAATNFNEKGVRRRTEREIPEPPSVSIDESPAPESPAHVFSSGKGLDYYINGMNPDFWEWVNPDEIAPGETTCGFLKPPLGTTPGFVFPTIEVYVCMRFANIQPAKKGNLFLHCGGPGSLSDCMTTLPPTLGPSVLDDYNFLTIDQRGLGRSWPSFGHEACNLYTPFVWTHDDTIIVDVTIPSELNGTDFSDIDSIKLSLEPYKRRMFRCWQCHDCGFRLNATQFDGKPTTFHFLEYSGTRQLAEDIERMRILLDSPVMNIYGASYGTSAFGTYATLFPQNVGLMVLDASVNPIPDLEYIAWTFGRGQDTRIDFALFACAARNAEEPGACPVADLPRCIGDVNSVFVDLGFGPGELVKQSLGRFIGVIFRHPDRAQELCDVAASDNPFDFLDLFDAVQAGEWRDVPEGRQMSTSPSKPTSRDAVFDNPNYEMLMFGGLEASMVEAQDGFSSFYDADYFAKRVVEFGKRHTGAGTGYPVTQFFGEFVKGFYWPKGVPLAPIGNPALTGIVAGQLYDPNTPYVWTQNMRNAFKYTSLLTSQATFHGLAFGPTDCHAHVIAYFETGLVPFVDGTVCGADFSNSKSLLVEAFF